MDMESTGVSSQEPSLAAVGVASAGANFPPQAAVANVFRRVEMGRSFLASSL